MLAKNATVLPLTGDIQGDINALLAARPFVALYTHSPATQNRRMESSIR